MPEMPTWENGEERMAALKEWLATNEDRDLRKREGDIRSRSGSGTEKKTTFVGALDSVHLFVLIMANYFQT
jgi:hypothetical protein